MGGLTKYSIRHPVLAMILVATITGILGFYLSQLRIHTSVYDLSIEHLPETKIYESFKKEFGTEEIILVVVRGSNVFSPQVFNRLEKLSEAFSRIKGIRKVISLPFIKKQVDLTQSLTLEEFERRIAPAALFQKNLISPDRKGTVITLLLDSGANEKSVITEVQRIINSEKDGLKIYQTGMPLVSQALANYTKADFMRLPPLTLLVMITVLLLLFKSLRGILIPVVSVLLALTWTFGLMGWTGTTLSMITMIVPVFIIAVGTAYSMYVLSEYSRATKETDSGTAAVLKCFESVSFPSVLAVATTLIGVGSLVLNRIQSIKEFALFSCFGILAMLVLLFTFVPSLLVLLGPGRPTGRKNPVERSDIFAKLLEKIILLNLRHQKKIYYVIGAVAVLSLAGITRIRVETNPVGYFKESTPVSQHFHDIYRDMAGSFPLSIVLDSKVEDYFEKPAHVRALLNIQKYAVSLQGIDKGISFADYLMLVNYASNRYNKAYYAIPEEGFELRILINKYRSVLGDDMFNRFMSPDLSKTTILLRTHISSSRRFLEVKKKLEAYISETYPNHFQVHVTGLGIVISQSSHLLTLGQIKSIGLTLALIFGTMLLLFLSGKAAGAALIPNCFPILVNFGLMGWLGIDLSLATSLVACVAIGLAVDDTIHYLVRYNTEFRKDLDKDRALTATLRKVGRPMIFTTITISAGFSVLAFSHFKPTSTFGLMMVAIMISALIGDLLLTPSLMLHIELVTAWDLLKLMPGRIGLPPMAVHELNQPLNAIKMGSEFLRMIAAKEGNIPKEHVLKVAQEVDTQTDRASEIIRSLTVFDQRPEISPRQVDLNETIRDVVRIVDHQLHLEDIELRLDLDQQLPMVLGHQNRLGQLIYVLVENAGEAINEREKKCNSDYPRYVEIRSAVERNEVVVTVSDSGVGIPEEIKRRIFEPFFSTKETGKGRGLGLSVVRQIVKDYGGQITFEGQYCKGSAFKITFPRRKNL
jgi:predicted RND superfamily exporter protein/two-component sensor histidine kinase